MLNLREDLTSRVVVCFMLLHLVIAPILTIAGAYSTDGPLGRVCRAAYGVLYAPIDSMMNDHYWQSVVFAPLFNRIHILWPSMDIRGQVVIVQLLVTWLIGGIMYFFVGIMIGAVFARIHNRRARKREHEL